MLVGSKRRSCVGQRRALRPSSGRLVSCPLWQVVTAETLMDPSDFSESQPAPTAGEVGEALRACSWQEGRVLQEGGSHACGSLARVSGWRMWTGTASPTGTPTSSPTLSSTQIKSNATGWGLLGTRGGRACLGWCGPPFGVPGTGPSNPPANVGPKQGLEGAWPRARSGRSGTRDGAGWALQPNPVTS